jgi:hypothetical protein
MQSVRARINYLLNLTLFAGITAVIFSGILISLCCEMAPGIITDCSSLGCAGSFAESGMAGYAKASAVRSES